MDSRNTQGCRRMGRTAKCRTGREADDPKLLLWSNNRTPLPLVPSSQLLRKGWRPSLLCPHSPVRWVSRLFILSPHIKTHQMCACGPTGQAATGSATRKTLATRQEDLRRRKLKHHKKLRIFVMKVRCSAVTQTAQVNLWSGYSSYSFQFNTMYF